MPERTLREKISLKKGEAYVIADMPFWNHIIQMYESQSVGARDEWQQMATYIRDWVDGTVYLGDEEDI